MDKLQSTAMRCHPTSFSCCPLLRNIVREIPLMSFGVFGAVAAMAVKRVLRFLENSCSGFFCPLEVRFDIVNIDIQTLRGLAEPLRIFVLRTGPSHHHDIVAELHGGMVDSAVCPAIL